MADAPYAFGSTLEREAALSEEDWRGRLARGRWFIAREKGEPLGMVAPSMRGTGVAASLVRAVLDWAVADGAPEVARPR